MSNPFRPTHQITVDTPDSSRHLTLVCESNGALYTAEEWASCDNADWELVDGAILFQGHPVNGSAIRKL